MWWKSSTDKSGEDSLIRTASTSASYLLIGFYLSVSPIFFRLCKLWVARAEVRWNTETTGSIIQMRDLKQSEEWLPRRPFQVSMNTAWPMVRSLVSVAESMGDIAMSKFSFWILR